MPNRFTRFKNKLSRIRGKDASVIRLTDNASPSEIDHRQIGRNYYNYPTDCEFRVAAHALASPPSHPLEPHDAQPFHPSSVNPHFFQKN